MVAIRSVATHHDMVAQINVVHTAYKEKLFCKNIVLCGRIAGAVGMIVRYDDGVRFFYDKQRVDFLRVDFHFIAVADRKLFSELQTPLFIQTEYFKDFLCFTPVFLFEKVAESL